MASHDLQEPLRMVTTYSQMLVARRESGDKAQLDQFAAYVAGGTARMRELLADVLAYSEIAGSIDRPAEIVDTKAVIDDALELLQARLEETGALVSVAEMPLLHAHHSRIASLFQNLIENAIKYRSEAPPHVRISVTRDDNEFTFMVADNGIGMNREELINNLGTIAKSGTQEFLSRLTGDGKKDLPLIGQFGVGFYSSFMIADKVTVVSTHAAHSETWEWESEGTGEFTISQVDKAPRGTSITLHLKSGEDIYLDKFRLRHIVQTYSDHISFPITITDEEGKTETVNAASALWMRPRSDITPEQYKEFYHHVSHAPDEPWLVLHNKAEGKVEYTSLLFIPSLKPFDPAIAMPA